MAAQSVLKETVRSSVALIDRTNLDPPSTPPLRPKLFPLRSNPIALLPFTFTNPSFAAADGPDSASRGGRPQIDGRAPLTTFMLRIQSNWPLRHLIGVELMDAWGSSSQRFRNDFLIFLILLLLLLKCVCKIREPWEADMKREVDWSWERGSGWRKKYVSGRTAVLPFLNFLRYWRCSTCSLLRNEERARNPSPLYGR